MGTRTIKALWAIFRVLPQKKVARYLQIENKIRAVVKYEIADGVPLVP